MATNDMVWLDASFVKKILQNSEKDKSIEVSGVTVKAATSKGDNYTSDLYRVAVEFSRSQDGRVIQEKKSIIIKIVPQNEVRAEMITATGFFVTELSMLSVTLPGMNELLEKVCPTSLGARCLYVQQEKPTLIVIEDLATQGFQMAVRHGGLNLDHCLLALRNLGRFHAASIALKEKDPKAWTKYTKWLFQRDQPSAQFFNLAVKKFAGETAKWPELSPGITEKLLKLSEVLFEKGCEAAVYREDDFNVLNHGDYWVNNMLFNYDEQQKPIDHIFVDFQLSHYGSPANDIFYFFGTSPSNEVRFKNRELLLREYHESLSSTMSKLECNTTAPSWEKLQEILKKRAFVEVIASLTILPYVALDEGDEIKIDEIMIKEQEYVNPGKSIMLAYRCKWMSTVEVILRSKCYDVEYFAEDEPYILHPARETYTSAIRRPESRRFRIADRQKGSELDHYLSAIANETCN